MFRTIRRWMKRLLPADHFHRRGLSKPVGREQFQIWTAQTLDGKWIGYMLTSGRTVNPVAFVFSAESNRRSAYRTARKIANDIALAGNETPELFNLTEFFWDDPGHMAFIADLVLFPTDRKGRGVFKTTDRELFGAMLDYDGGLRFPLVKGGHRRHAWNVIPTFNAPIAEGDWCEVPADLKLHLDKIDPKEKSGQSAVVALSSGKSESNKISEVAAA